MRAKSCCTENTITTRGVKETRLGTDREESTWNYYSYDDFIAVYLQKGTYKKCGEIHFSHIFRYTNKVDFMMIDKSSLLSRLHANLSMLNTNMQIVVTSDQML